MSQPVPAQVVDPLEAAPPDTSKMDDVALETKIDKGLEAETPATPPTKETDKGTPAEPTTATPPEEKPPQLGPDGKPIPTIPPAEPGTETLLAGKYKTTDDLAKGVMEILGPLKYNSKPFERLIELAKKTGDWSAVEETYKDLFDTLSKNQKAAEAAAPKEGTEQTETPSAETEAQLAAEQYKVVIDETYRAIEQNPLVKEMATKGISIPRTKEDWEKMKDEHPYYASRFDLLITSTYNQITKEVQDYVKARGESDAHNAQAKTDAKQQITESIKQLKIEGVTDDVIDKAIENALKSDTIYEDRHGVGFIRENGIMEYFLAKEFPRLAKLIKLNGELDGRTQHLEDLEAMKKKNIQSISTASIPGTRAKEVKIDVNDPSQVARLSDEEIEKQLRAT